MMIATCSGTRERGTGGGVAPLGCGFGFFT
jgi:hypothetical protein